MFYWGGHIIAVSSLQVPCCVTVWFIASICYIIPRSQWFSVADMASVKEIVQYISGCTEFFRSQEGLLSEKLKEESVASMAATVVGYIGKLRTLDAPGASALNAAISSSAFPGATKTDFATAVVQRLTAPAGDGGNEASKQVMAAPHNYPTESDWAYIRDKSKSLQQVCIRVRERMRLLGLNNISEKTYGYLASMIAAAREPDMAGPALKALVDDLKSVAIADDIPPVAIHTFPVMPNDLPQSLFVRAYAQEPPCPQTFADYNSIVKRCPVRKSHKSVRGYSVPRGGGAVVAAGAPTAVESMGRAMMPIIENAMANFCSTMLGSNRRIAFGEQGHQSSESSGSGQGALHIFADGAAGRQSRPPIVPTKIPALADAPVGGTRELETDPPANQAGQLVPHDGGHGGGKDSRSATDIVAEMERTALGHGGGKGCERDDVSNDDSQAKPQKKPARRIPVRAHGWGRPKTTMKLPSAALRAPPKPGKLDIKKKPASKSSKPLLLGCTRCRGSHLGCLSCRNPDFTGRRWQK